MKTKMIATIPGLTKELEHIFLDWEVFQSIPYIHNRLGGPSGERKGRKKKDQGPDLFIVLGAPVEIEGRLYIKSSHADDCLGPKAPVVTSEISAYPVVRLGQQPDDLKTGLFGADFVPASNSTHYGGAIIGFEKLPDEQFVVLDETVNFYSEREWDLFWEELHDAVANRRSDQKAVDDDDREADDEDGQEAVAEKPKVVRKPKPKPLNGEQLKLF